MTVRTQNQGQWLYIAGTWLLCGSLDMAAAMLINPSVPVAKICRFIASGFFGKEAATGANMVIYGMLFHYIIALLFTILFFKTYPFWRRLLKNQIVISLVIGLIIWCVMNLVVLPLSNTPKFPMKLVGVLKNIAALIVAFGVPIPFVAERYYRKD